MESYRHGRVAAKIPGEIVLEIRRCLRQRFARASADQVLPATRLSACRVHAPSGCTTGSAHSGAATSKLRPTSSPVNVLGVTPDDLENLPVQDDLLSEYRRTPAEISLPERIAQHRCLRAASRMVIARPQQPSQHGLHSKNGEEIATHPQAIGQAQSSIPVPRKGLGTPCRHRGKGLLLLPQLLPYRERKFLLAPYRAAHPSLWTRSTFASRCGSCTGSVRSTTASIS